MRELHKSSKLKEHFYSPQHAVDIVKRLLHQSNVIIDKATPMAQGHLGNNIRITALNAGEKYLIIPSYSPENEPLNYHSPITANAAMDIAAAKDGLRMTVEMERTVKAAGYEDRIEKWEALPALPKAWSTGSIQGLRARTNAQVDLQWTANSVTVTVTSDKAQTIKVGAFGGEATNAEFEKGETKTFTFAR